jgi:hypothetical protein
MENDRFKYTLRHNIHMATTGNPIYGKSLSRQVQQAQKHYSLMNKQATHVFPHCQSALNEGIRGNIVDPVATFVTNPVSYDISNLLLYHLFLNKKHLPKNVTNRLGAPFDLFDGQIVDGPFGLFNDIRNLMVIPGKTKSIAAIFDEERIPIRTRLVVLLSHMADAMTLHSHETLAALPYGALRHENNSHELMFANPQGNWTSQVEIMSHFMRDILCPAADIFGMSYVYRRIRDLAAAHLYPTLYSEVRSDISKMENDILRTNLLMEGVLKSVRSFSDEKEMTLKVISRNQDATRMQNPGLEERKSDGSITDKLSKKRGQGQDLVVRDIHDIVARMIIMDTEAEIYSVASVFDELIVADLGSVGINTVVLKPGIEAPPESEWPANVGAMIETTDYIKNPKKPTDYTSLHKDVIFRKSLPYVNCEAIFRTHEMHTDCDEGAKAHHIYKNGSLKNGLLVSFKKLLQNLQANGGDIHE